VLSFGFFRQWRNSDAKNHEKSGSGVFAVDACPCLFGVFLSAFGNNATLAQKNHGES